MKVRVKIVSLSQTAPGRNSAKLNISKHYTFPVLIPQICKTNAVTEECSLL
jgi:hypothetical protein